MIFTLVKCGFFLVNPLDSGIFWSDLTEINNETADLIKIAVQCALMLIIFLFLIPTR